MNYIYLGRKYYLHYAYIDTKNYLADPLFNKNEVWVKFGDEYNKEGENYIVMFCKIKKRDQARFERTMLELRNKMLICGHNDYDEFCEDLFRRMKNEE